MAHEVKSVAAAAGAENAAAAVKYFEKLRAWASMQKKSLLHLNPGSSQNRCATLDRRRVKKMKGGIAATLAHQT